MSLEDYKISPVTGFVPLNPLVRLPDVYFDPWEKIMDRFSDLISTDSLHKEIQELPLLDATRLKTWQEYQRAFLVLCFLTHGYVWKDVGRISETLAPQLAIPLVKVSDYLGMNPVLCHASVALWNYQLVDPKGPIDLSNMEALATFTGTSDESWFHNVTAFVEISGAPCLPEILSAIQLDNEPDQLEVHLNKIRDALIQMNLALPRLFEKLDPKVFYCQIRPFLSGWTSDPLPRGLKYDDEYRSYSGASAAQSCLIATLDVALGVEHYGHSSKPNEFMQAMRQYMPKPHREFLEMVQTKSLIRPCVMQLENTHKTVLAYNECVHQLKLFRDKHVQIVSLYIINQARKESQADTKELKGTAGASVIPFLKKSRDETNQTKIPQPETVTHQIEKTQVNTCQVEKQSWWNWLTKK